MQFTNIDCNSTAVNAPFGSNWVQNTDGFDTMDSQNILLENFTCELSLLSDNQVHETRSLFAPASL